MARAASKPKKEISMEEALWKSADKLRGSVEPAEYKHVVLSLFFLKFASDKFEAQRKAISEKYGEKFVDNVAFYTKDNVFFLPEISRWSFIMENAKQDDIVDYVDDYIFDGEYLLLSEDGIYVVDDSGHPLLQHIIGKFWANNHAHILKGKAGFTEDSLYLFLSNTNMSPIVTGAAQPKINQANLKSFPITIPDSEVLDRFNSVVHPLFAGKLNNEKEIRKLETIRELLLSRLVS